MSSPTSSVSRASSTETYAEPKLSPPLRSITPPLLADDPRMWNTFLGTILKFEGGKHFERELFSLAAPDAKIYSLSPSMPLVAKCRRYYSEKAEGAIMWEINDPFPRYDIVFGDTKQGNKAGREETDGSVKSQEMANAVSDAQTAWPQGPFTLLLLFSTTMAASSIIVFRESVDYLNHINTSQEITDKQILHTLDSKVAATIRNTATSEIPDAILLTALIRRSFRFGRHRPISYKVFCSKPGSFQDGLPHEHATVPEVRGWLVSWFTERNISTNAFSNYFDAIWWNGRDIRRVSREALVETLDRAGFSNLVDPLVESIVEAVREKDTSGLRRKKDFWEYCWDALLSVALVVLIFLGYGWFGWPQLSYPGALGADFVFLIGVKQVIGWSWVLASRGGEHIMGRLLT